MKSKAKTPWTPEQQRLLINWAEKSTGYAWLHNRSVNFFKNRNLYITIPASFFGYIAGATSFISGGEGSITIYTSTIIGICGILAGLLTNFQEIFTFKELGEQHRISAIRFLSFFRDISCELSIHPNDRTDPIEYITMKRMELDKLLEQSPMPPQCIIDEFNTKFKKVQIHKPDLANNLQTIIPYGGCNMGNKQYNPYKRLSKKQLMKKYFYLWRNIANNNKKNRLHRDYGSLEVANSETSSIRYNPNDVNVHFDNEENTSTSSNTTDSYTHNIHNNKRNNIRNNMRDDMNNYDDIITSKMIINNNTSKRPLTDILSSPLRLNNNYNDFITDEIMARRVSAYEDNLDNDLRILNDKNNIILEAMAK